MSSLPDLEALRDAARTWLASNPVPEPHFERPESVMTVSAEPQLEYLRSWQRRAYDAGFVGVEWPQEYGGRGLARGAQRIVDQEFGRAGTPPLLNIVALNWAGPIILRHGTDAQKQRFIRPLLRGDEIWCQGFSEPGAGSDLASLQMRARREGEEYVIDGHKVWTTLGLYADHMILLARTNPDEPRHGGISYFLSPMRVPGIEVQPLVKLTGELGFNQVIFTDVRIPADTLLGREGEGWKLAVETLQFERGAEEGGGGSSGGGSSGGGRGGAVEDLIELARNRERDGRPLLDDAVVRDRIAGFAIEAAAVRVSRERLRVPGLVVDRPMVLPLMSKVVGSELNQRLTDFASELQGWDETLVGKWQHRYLSSYEGTIAGGTSEVQRNILGEKILGLPKGR